MRNGGRDDSVGDESESFVDCDVSVVVLVAVLGLADVGGKGEEDDESFSCLFFLFFPIPNKERIPIDTAVEEDC